MAFGVWGSFTVDKNSSLAWLLTELLMLVESKRMPRGGTTHAVV
jgi:hypothetical protein